MASDSKYYVFVDIESTGVNFDGNDEIIEIAAILTDTDYNEIGEPFESLVQPTDKWISKMNSFVREMHTKNGLIDDVVRAWGDSKITPLKVDMELTKWLCRSLGYNEHEVRNSVAQRAKIFSPDIDEMLVLAGASIQADEKWMRQQLPTFFGKLHYRQNDVSGFLGVIDDFNPTLAEGIRAARPDGDHRALADIQGSLYQARIIRQFMEARVTAQLGWLAEQKEQ